MLTLPFGTYDAFALPGQLYTGNPAAVVLIDRPDYPSDHELFLVAREFNLSETAFLLKVAGGEDYEYRLRWFTPDGTEVKLCGHAYVVQRERERDVLA
jgi:PhzF family phenazine biosynthesis protein